MFRPAANSAKSTKGKGGNSSESDSDWDTTVDFPVPGGNDNANDTDNDDNMPAQPTPKTRASLTVDKGKDSRSGEGTPRSARGEKSVPSSAKRNVKTPASASAVRLSPFDSDSRDTSPVPPFNFGSTETNKRKSEGSSRGPSSSPDQRERKGNRYEMSPTPKVPASMEAAIPTWDDSDAEQRTLQELHNTFKKEKSREIESKAARKQIREGGDNSYNSDHNVSHVENHRQGKGDVMTSKNVQKEREDAVVVAKEKSGVLSHWLHKDGTSAASGAENVPHHPFIVKDTDGKRFIYHFNKGNTEFFEVEEETSEAVMPKMAEKVEGYIKRGWQEFFGALRIVTSIAIYLAVEAVSFVTNHITRPLIIGVVITIGNRLVKPLLAGLFNLLLQPVVIFFWNVASGLRHALQPVIDILGGVLTKVAIMVQAFRLVEVNYGNDRRQNWRIMGYGGGGGRNDGEVV